MSCFFEHADAGWSLLHFRHLWAVVEVAVTIELIIAPACFLGWRWECAGSWALVHWGLERAQVRAVVK